MKRALTLVTVWGIPIRVHVSFVLIIALNAWQWSMFGARGALFGAVLSAFVFTCVALHELGHALVAKAFGIGVTDMTLYPIGGIARLSRRPETPGQELLIALAGPLVNVVIAGVLAGLGVALFGAPVLLETLRLSRDHAPTGLTLWVWLAASNAGLAVFNLLPALPMDGGRVLRALLAWVVGQRQATRWAAVVGRVLAVGLFGLGLASGNFMLPFIAAMVFFGAGAEVRDTELQRLLDGVKAKDAVNTQLPRFAPSTTVGEALQALLFWPARAFAVEHSGRLVGVATRERILEVLRSPERDHGPSSYIAALMERAVPQVQARDSLEVARQRMGDGSFVAVYDGDVFLGLLTDAEFAHQVTVLEAFRESAERARRARTKSNSARR